MARPCGILVRLAMLIPPGEPEGLSPRSAHRLVRLALLLLGGLAAPLAHAAEVNSLDGPWQFTREDKEEFANADFDDAAWRTVDVPHDWSIEGPYDRDAPTGRGGAYLPAGVGWYRKTFKLPAEDVDRRVFVEFDGVMAHSEMWVNGVRLGDRPFGYASFRYELTPHVKFGADAENVIAVRADNTRQPASRWYAGAGIYRHVRLHITDNAGGWDKAVTCTFIRTEEVSAESAVVIVSALVNHGDVDFQARVTIRDPDGHEVAQGQMPRIETDLNTTEISVRLAVKNPELWSPDAPRLYTAVVEARSNDRVLDFQRTPFGIRAFRFEAKSGFWLNDENIKIKGVCLHHDGGAVGAAVPKAVWRRRLETLKSLGVNGIRTAHNPASPEFLDLCDELGFVVMHEVFDCWNDGKNNAQNGYNHDFHQWWERDQRDAVLRDRNHPSIILYSAGNEIRDNLRAPAAFEQFKKMKAIYDELDGTRPVTMAVFRPNQSRVYASGFSELMDVVGQNYRENELVRAHRDKPTRKILGTENSHERLVWLMMRDNPFYSGQFLWTGIEYMGESDWPYTTWGDALVDRAGFVKTRGLQRQSWWTNEPMVAIARREAASGGASGRGSSERVDHWTPRDPDTYDEAVVSVYSNCAKVELILNGASQGKEAMPADARPAVFRVAYEPGTLEAVGYNDGKEAARQTLKSADFPAKLRITTDKSECTSDFDDAVHAVIEVIDADGNRCPWADTMINLEITGPGKLLGVDNADPQSHESFQEPKRRAYRGRILAIVRPTADEGEITLKAMGVNLDPAVATIKAIKARY
jgi:beta-galactosidase